MGCFSELTSRLTSYSSVKLSDLHVAMVTIIDPLEHWLSK